MTKEEVLVKITSVHKYYANVYEQSHAHKIVAAIRAGTCKPETESKFFSAFGYVIDQPASYKMKLEKWFDEVKALAKSNGFAFGHIKDYEEEYFAGYTPQQVIDELNEHYNRKPNAG